MDMGSKVDLTARAGAAARAPLTGEKRLSTRYDVVARRPRAGLRPLVRTLHQLGWPVPNWMTRELWSDSFHNLVVTAGLNDSLDKHLKGAAYTAAWYVGLTDGTPTFAAGDTMDGAHAGWTEVTAYDELVRQTLTLGAVAAGSVNNSAAPAVFTIDTNATTIGGAFIVSDDTKGGAVGVLYGGGAFTAGDKSLDDDDTLTVTVTLTAAAA